MDTYPCKPCASLPGCRAVWFPDRGRVAKVTYTMRSTGQDYAQIAEGYANAFPDGNDPLRIMLRLSEELGEVAEAVARLEGHGLKRLKHGEPDVSHLATEVEDLVHNAFALLRVYGAEAEFDSSVERTLADLHHDGRL